MQLSESPADEFDRRRMARRDVALTRISRLNRWWLIGQIATLGLLCGGLLLLGPDAWFAMLVMQGVWVLSLLSAGGSAGVTLWNWSVLPGVWRAVGLAPWAILLMEVTVIATGVR